MTTQTTPASRSSKLGRNPFQAAAAKAPTSGKVLKTAAKTAASEPRTTKARPTAAPKWNDAEAFLPRVLIAAASEIYLLRLKATLFLKQWLN